MLLLNHYDGIICTYLPPYAHQLLLFIYPVSWNTMETQQVSISIKSMNESAPPYVYCHEGCR